jgi:hypothetical protein
MEGIRQAVKRDAGEIKGTSSGKRGEPNNNIKITTYVSRHPNRNICITKANRDVKARKENVRSTKT